MSRITESRIGYHKGHHIVIGVDKPHLTQRHGVWTCDMRSTFPHWDTSRRAAFVDWLDRNTRFEINEALDVYLRNRKHWMASNRSLARMQHNPLRYSWAL